MSEQVIHNKREERGNYAHMHYKEMRKEKII